jgi:hypothetical protein
MIVNAQETTSTLTQYAQRNLISSLERFGNHLNTDHKQALVALVDGMTRMAEGRLKGRWAYGLPTGTGKTRAIIEWTSSVHSLGHPYNLAVSASRIEALCTLKRDLIANGVPAEKIGLLHNDPEASEPATDDNDERPFMLITHQRIRANEQNLRQYNFYQGQPRSLLLYDESLFASDVTHFGLRPLLASIAHAIETLKGIPEHIQMSNYLNECKTIIEWHFDNYDEEMAAMIQQPKLDPALATKYIQHFQKTNSILSDFLLASNIPLRMLRAGSTAVVTYRVVVPAALTNILVLDASYPIRSLCHHDASMRARDQEPGMRPFHLLKRFDHVDLYRLKTYGGRSSMEKRFRDRKMVKEVVNVLKTIPAHEAVLMFVYKKRDCVERGGTIDYRKILLAEIRKAGINPDSRLADGRPRLVVETWGNETSLNCYAHCQHVFLVGILHRDETELLGQYLGQIHNLEGQVSAVLGKFLQRSEKAHLAYQALSRGACRVVDDGQAGRMHGYIVEVDPMIEEQLSVVMPGAKWRTWEPKYVAEAGNLIETWAQRLRDYLDILPTSVGRVSSRQLKQTLKAYQIAPRTWAEIIKRVGHEKCNLSKKENMEQCTFALNKTWYLEKSSLVRGNQLAEAYGF